jgi:hypothetical protein
MLARRGVLALYGAQCPPPPGRPITPTFRRGTQIQRLSIRQVGRPQHTPSNVSGGTERYNSDPHCEAFVFVTAALRSTEQCTDTLRMSATALEGPEMPTRHTAQHTHIGVHLHN